MNYTPFPTRPVDVVALTCSEFLFDLEMSGDPSLDVVCRRFADDVNRALVWLIRFRALRTWCARTDITEWLSTRSASQRDVCEVAAGFELNDRWEFDVERFCCAVNGVIRQRGEIERW
jgi:hypothetical protein